MMLCKKCGQVTARVVTKRELGGLSKRHYAGPAVATAATAVAATVVKTAGSGAVGLLANGAKEAAKAATKGPKELLIAAGITAGVAAVGAGVKYLLSKREAGNKSYAYCASCGHYEAMA